MLWPVFPDCNTAMTCTSHSFHAILGVFFSCTVSLTFWCVFSIHSLFSTCIFSFQFVTLLLAHLSRFLLRAVQTTHYPTTFTPPYICLYYLNSFMSCSFLEKMQYTEILVCLFNYFFKNNYLFTLFFISIKTFIWVSTFSPKKLCRKKK